VTLSDAGGSIWLPESVTGSAASAEASRDAPSTMPDFARRIPVGRYRGLHPVTKPILAWSGAIVALGVRGWTGPAVVLAAVVLSGALAGSCGRMALFRSGHLSRLVVSILLVNTFLYPNARDAIVTLAACRPT